MKIWMLSLFFIMPITSYGATLVPFGATLCGPNKLFAAGRCQPKIQGRCSDGFYKILTSSLYTTATRCHDAYEQTVLPDSFNVLYNSAVIDFGATLCAPNEHFGAGKCQPKKQGKCPNGSYKTLIYNNTLSLYSADTGCYGAYEQIVLPDSFSVFYGGTVINFGATLCGVGKYLSNNQCVSRTRGTCPENFLDATVADATVTSAENSECKEDYLSFWMNGCADNEYQNQMCAVVCDAGMVPTGVGVCASVCSVNADRNVTLNALGGLKIPLYSTRVTKPSLNVETSNGKTCYGILSPGKKRGGLNITVSGKDYHLVD